MAKNMVDVYGSYSPMAQRYAKKTTPFPFGQGIGIAASPANYKAKPGSPAMVDFGLVAVYEKNGKRGITPSLLQTYKHPQTNKPGQTPAEKQAEQPLHHRNQSLNEQSKAYADKFKETPGHHKGSITAEQKQPDSIGKLQKGSPVYPKNPLERAEQIYNDWNKSLSELTKEYLESLQANMNDLGTVVDDEQKQQLEEQLYQWTSEQREQLENSLADLPHGIAKKYLTQADQTLENVTDSMWGSIEEMISRHNGAIQTAEQLYSEWNESLGGLSGNYFDAFKENLSKLSGAVSDEQKQTMYQGLTEWLTQQGNNLGELLKDSPDGILRLLMERADEHLNDLGDRLWSQMEEEIRKHNLSIPPVNRPPVQVPFPADSVFRPGSSVKIEVIQGNRKASLMLRDPSSLTNGKTMFYVIDALGNKKAVSITFNDVRLQEEFNKRFKASSMYGKTVSLEKFNRFVEKLKSSLREINEVDMERLRSKIFGKEEGSRLDVLVKSFSDLLNKMKM